MSRSWNVDLFPGTAGKKGEGKARAGAGTGKRTAPRSTHRTAAAVPPSPLLYPLPSLPSPLLIADDEGSRALVHEPPLSPSSTILTDLEYGDVAVVGNGPAGPITAGIEVKSVCDFLGSTVSGRLQGRQIPGMLSIYDISIVIIYGEHRAGPDNELMYRSCEPDKSNHWKMWDPRVHKKPHAPYLYLRSRLVELALCGVWVVEVPTYSAVAWWCWSLAYSLGKPWDKHKDMHTLNCAGTISDAALGRRYEEELMPALAPAVLYRAQVARKLAPGIGYTRAVEAAKRFGSVKRMVNGTEKEWREVEGVGPVLARKITGMVAEEDEAVKGGPVKGRTGTVKRRLTGR